jgi:hypothetical protein
MQRPSALGLFLCDQVIFDRDTNRPTPVGIFSTLRCDRFPSAAHSFDVFAALTDGQGQVTLEITVTRLDTDQEASVIRREFDFPDPLAVLNLRFRVRTLSFPVPGVYLFELLADGEVICHRRLTVLPEGEAP